MLTNGAGRNEALLQEHFETRFGFPVLLIHGMKNRVFDWRGSRNSHQLFCRLRERSAQLAASAATPGVDPVDTGPALHWGAGQTQQLMVFKDYGHQDMLIGQGLQTTVFSAMHGFFAQTAGKSSPPPTPEGLPIEFERPWLGPMLRHLSAAAAPAGVLNLKVLVHPHPRRARTFGLVLVPMLRQDGKLVPLLDKAAGWVPTVTGPAAASADGDDQLGSQADLAINHSEQLLAQPVLLRLSAPLIAQFEAVTVLTVHSDLPLAHSQVFRSLTSVHWEMSPARWLLNGLALQPNVQQRLAQHFNAPDDAAQADQAVIRLAATVCLGADRALAAAQPLCFALASCQYPPGLLDEVTADASWRQLLADTDAEQAPQWLLLVGDQVYVDATAGVFDPAPRPMGDAPSAGAFGDALDKVYELPWRLPAMRAVTARLPVYMMLDDHEVRDDWRPRPSDAQDSEVQARLQAYQRYQAAGNPPAMPSGRHYTMQPGGAPCFVLDSRSQRQWRRVDADSEGNDLESAQIVPAATMLALKQWLEGQPAACAKFIVSPSHLLPPERFDDARSPAGRLASDTWSGYPHSLVELIGFIRDQRIGRVVFLSGDAHFSLASRCRLDNGVVLHSVVSSGLYAPWPFANMRPESLRLQGAFTISDGARQIAGEIRTECLTRSDGYALLALNGPDGDPHAQLEVRFRGPGQTEPLQTSFSLGAPTAPAAGTPA